MPQSFVGLVLFALMRHGLQTKLKLQRAREENCKDDGTRITPKLIIYYTPIKKFLSISSTKALVHAFVTCRLDNCNSLLYGLPKHLVHRLQLAQNCAARLILCGRKHDHVTPLLRELHWLPVEQRIIFKMLFFTFKALNNLCPSYISDLLETYKPTMSLRSSSRNLLVIPRSRLKSHGDRAFSVSAPKLWNDIPETIKCSVDLNAFKRNLQTYLFKRYFYE